jgi:hypothetical protein
MHVARIVEKKNAYNRAVGQPEGKRSLGEKKSRWEDNIKMGCREIWWEVLDWMHLTQNRA